GVWCGRDIELRDDVVAHLLVAALLEEGRDLGGAVGRPHLEPSFPERVRRRARLAPARVVDLVEPHLRVGQVLEAGDRNDLHRLILARRRPEGPWPVSDTRTKASRKSAGHVTARLAT